MTDLQKPKQAAVSAGLRKDITDDRPAIVLDMYAYACREEGAPQHVLDAIAEAAKAVRTWRAPAHFDKVDTTNRQLVGRRGDGTVVITFPQSAMTRQQALVHAAWLVLVCMPAEGEFEDILSEVQSA